jgi:hypothetical protein
MKYPPKISKKSVDDLIHLMKSQNDPLSKKLREVEKEAQKNVMKMFSKDGGKDE